MRAEETWFIDDTASEDAGDWAALPEVKALFSPRAAEEASFRGLIEDPDALSNLPWCGETDRARPRRTPRKTRLVGRLH